MYKVESFNYFRTYLVNYTLVKVSFDNTIVLKDSYIHCFFFNLGFLFLNIYASVHLEIIMDSILAHSRRTRLGIILINNEVEFASVEYTYMKHFLRFFVQLELDDGLNFGSIMVILSRGVVSF